MIFRILAWLVAVPAAVLGLLYVVLLVSPVPLHILRQPALTAVRALMPPSYQLDLGEISLALEGAVWPVLKVSPVVFTDTKSGAKVRMEGLAVGFSPVRALVGHPGATVTIIGPHIQLVQDLFGPRLSTLEIVENPEGGDATVRVLEGEDAFPSAGIGAGGIDIDGTMPGGAATALRSDNDWLIYNLKASEVGLRDVVIQAQQGRFSRLIVRDGIIDMSDSVYGMFRRFEDVSLDVVPSADGSEVSGTFSASLGGSALDGSLRRTIEEGGRTRLAVDIANIDFGAFMPMTEDASGPVAVQGVGALSMAVDFDATTSDVLDGNFKVDLTGSEIRVENDTFPLVTSIVEVDWEPEASRFTLQDAEIRLGDSSAKLSGVLVMGLDENYGPTLGMSMTAKDVMISPGDLGPPEHAFTQVAFTGWSAPLYGAVGIDQFIATKPGAVVTTTGRIDSVRAGMGFNVSLAGQGITADDIKRLWPYFLAPEARDWLVASVQSGVIENASMRFDFPVGSLPKPGEDKPLPPNSMNIDMVASGVSVVPMEGMDPVAIDGQLRFNIHDTNIAISGDGASVQTEGGTVSVANAALVVDSSDPAQRIIEVSGDLDSPVAALIALAKQYQPDLLTSTGELPINLDAVTGELGLSMVATIPMGEGEVDPTQIDYVVNGNVSGLGSAEPVAGRVIGNGQLAFSASQDGYQLAGSAEVDGIAANIEVSGTPQTQPEMLFSARVDAADLGNMGVDVSEFITGSVELAARPVEDGSIQVAVGLDDAALTVKDLAISKPAGTPGMLQAAIRQSEEGVELSQIDLGFGDVRLQGAMQISPENELQSAEFSRVALSAGDDMRLSLAPLENGYAVTIRGEQLDLKPMLQHFFGLGEGTGGVAATSVDQTMLQLDVELDKVLGFYSTTAFNFDLDLALRGTDLRRVNLQTNFGNDKSVSVTTNPDRAGKTMIVAFNDLGTILRLAGVYPRVLGGEGSLVMTTRTAENADYGQFDLRNFALVDEENVAEVLGNHAASRQLVSARNRLDFDSGTVTFIRRPDKIEVTNALLAGDTVGGTMRGNIYTEQRQLDLTGTYVPLFGLNSAFSRLPLFGPLLTGRDGAGLIGVTFAVRGELDSPQFRVNPASALLPGAFRELFEFRTREERERN